MGTFIFKEIYIFCGKVGDLMCENNMNIHACWPNSLDCVCHLA